MPLQTISAGDSFTQIDDILVDSSRDKRSSDTNATFVMVLPSIYTNVIAVEIVDYHMPTNLMSQFSRSNYIDFRLRNTAIFAGGWKTLVAILPQEKVIYHTPEEVPGCNLSIVLQAFKLAILRDSDFGGKVDIVPVPEPNERIQILCRTLVYPPAATWPGFGTTECELLFGTGVNKHRSAAVPLGFDQVDLMLSDITLGGKLFKTAIAARQAIINRFSYIDILINEFPELKPVVRVFLPELSGSSVALRDEPTRVRLLTNPVRSLRTLSIAIRLRDNIVPQEDLPSFFTVRIFYQDQTHSIPYYGRHRLQVR